MKLLKIKMFLHAIIGIFSCAFAGIMILETHCNAYPDFFCWVCVVVSAINAAYSFYLCSKCEERLEKEMKAKW
jgi:hypothetical protein